MARQHSSQIEAELTYCRDDGTIPVNETKDATTKIPSYSGNFDHHRMLIQNGRQTSEKFSLEINGFELVKHDTKVEDFIKGEEIETIYYPEIIKLVKKYTMAVKVVVFDHTIRTGDQRKRGKMLLREPVKRVHNDYTDWSGPQRVRDIMLGEAEALLKKRVAIIQVWRPIQKILQANPLALCDARSLEQTDLIISERRFPDRVGQTYQVKHNKNHLWFYFPEMRRDEAIIFKVYDSKKDGRPRFTPHTSFEDPSTPGNAPSRESIEVRALVFFD